MEEWRGMSEGGERENGHKEVHTGIMHMGFSHIAMVVAFMNAFTLSPSIPS